MIIMKVFPKNCRMFMLERDSDYYAQYVGIGWIWQDTILPES